jgi:hypothetical protein
LDLSIEFRKPGIAGSSIPSGSAVAVVRNCILRESPGARRLLSSVTERASTTATIAFAALSIVLRLKRQLFAKTWKVLPVSSGPGHHR